MQQLMTKENLDKFLNKEFPQVSKNFKILDVLFIIVVLFCLIIVFLFPNIDISLFLFILIF